MRRLILLHTTQQRQSRVLNSRLPQLVNLIMKKLSLLYILLALLISYTPLSAATPTAAELVDAAAAKMRASQSTVIDFTAQGGDGAATTVKGRLTLSGDRFIIDSNDAKIWYDGKTQWSWSAAADEVNITEPTIEEVAQVNPYAILNSLRSRYKARYQGSPSDRTVILTPSMPDPAILHTEISFTPDGYPSKMKVRTSSGDNITITVSRVTPGKALPISTFRFIPAKAPGAEIVDLR